jgi:hypothetical protein
MAETRRKFDRDFKEGAVRLVRETGRPIAQVAKGLSINDGCCGRSRPGSTGTPPRRARQLGHAGAPTVTSQTNTPAFRIL